MKYILLIYQDENSQRKPHGEECAREAHGLTQELTARGQYLASAPLHPTSTATSVRIRDGKRLVTDGPFAETHEQLGGFYLIDTPTLDEAIDVAGRISGAATGTVEIRPVKALPGLPIEE